MGNVNAKSAKRFDILEEQLLTQYDEMDKLSKKKPDGALNEFKISIVNQLLSELNKYLFEDYRPISEFSEFSIEIIPSASDVIFVLAQYKRALEEFRYENTIIDGVGTYWKLGNNKEGPPTKRSRLNRLRDR